MESQFWASFSTNGEARLAALRMLFDWVVVVPALLQLTQYAAEALAARRRYAAASGGGGALTPDLCVPCHAWTDRH
jgi:hypothetical protein